MSRKFLFSHSFLPTSKWILCRSILFVLLTSLACAPLWAQTTGGGCSIQSGSSSAAMTVVNVNVNAGNSVTASQDASSTIGVSITFPDGSSVSGQGSASGTSSIAGVANIQFNDASLVVFNYSIQACSPSFNFGNLNAGTASPTSAFTYSFNSTFTLTSVQVLTQGVAGLDFANAGTGNCAATTYNVGQSCTVDGTFTPAAPGLRMGAVVLSTSAGPLITTYVYGVGMGPVVTFQPFAVTSPIVQGLNDVRGVTVDAANNIYILDYGNNRILIIATDSSQTTINTAGSGLMNPQGIAVDGAGNIYVANGNYTGTVVKFSSGGSNVSQNIVVPGGVNEVSGVAVDGAGNVYTAEFEHNRVLKITPAGNQSTIVSGLFGPTRIAVDASSNLYIFDSDGDGVIIRVSPSGSRNTVAQSSFSEVLSEDIAVDTAGNIYAQTRTFSCIGGCHDVFNIVKFTPSRIQTLANGPGSNFAVGATGNVYFSIANSLGSSSLNQLIVFTPPSLTFGTVINGANSSSQTVGITNIGNSELNISSLSVSPNSYIQQATGSADCAAGITLASDASCNIQLVFQPTTTGDIPGSVTIADNAANSPQTFPLTGTGQKATFLAPSSFNFGKVNAGTASPTTTFTYSFNSTFTLASVQVLTQGAAGLDYANAGTGTCTATTYNVGQSCTVDVTFTPAAPGLRMGAVVLSTSAGPLIITYVYGVGMGSVVAFQPYIEQKVLDGLYQVKGVTVDASGNIYIMDSGNNRILIVAPDGTETAINTTSSGLYDPQGIAVDGAGNIYIANGMSNNVLVFPPVGSSGNPSIIGTGLYDPQGIAVDGAGNVFIGDTGNQRVIKM